MTNLPHLTDSSGEESFRRLKEIRVELQRLLEQEEELLAWRRMQIDEIERLAVAFSISPGELRTIYKALQRERSKQVAQPGAKQVAQPEDSEQHGLYLRADRLNQQDPVNHPDHVNNPPKQAH